jgi:hypothetical protein
MAKSKAIFTVLFIFMLSGIYLAWSGTQADTHELILHEITGRDEGQPNQRNSIYRVKAPSNWSRTDPAPNESIADSMKSLCEFWISDGDNKIRIVIHNFPTYTLEERIPPIAQIIRWKRQFDDLDQASVSVTPQSYGGFTGLLFTGTGHQKGQLITVMGWSMQIASEHYRHLCPQEAQAKTRICRQMRADYTIKATGSADLIEKYRSSLTAFANSFELIEEIPTRS